LSQQQSGITSLICLEDNTGNVVLQALQLRHHLDWDTIQKRVAVVPVSIVLDCRLAFVPCFDQADPVWDGWLAHDSCTAGSQTTRGS